MDSAETPEDIKIKEALPLVGERLEKIQIDQSNMMASIDLLKTKGDDLSKQVQFGFKEQSQHVSR